MLCCIKRGDYLVTQGAGPCINTKIVLPDKKIHITETRRPLHRVMGFLTLVIRNIYFETRPWVLADMSFLFEYPMSRAEGVDWIVTGKHWGPLQHDLIFMEPTNCHKVSRHGPWVGAYLIVTTIFKESMLYLTLSYQEKCIYLEPMYAANINEAMKQWHI